MKNLCLSVAAFFCAACGGKGQSTIDKFGREANFPMFYTSVSEKAGGCALYKVSEVSIGQSVASTLVIDGLSNIGGAVQDLAGNIYLAVNQAAPAGKILRILAGSSEAKDFILNLDYPTGVAVDTFNQVYVIENGKHQVSRLDAAGSYTTFKSDELQSPEVGLVDTSDNLFLVEGDAKVVSKISPSGVREVMSPMIAGIRDVAVDNAGVVHVISADNESGLGKVLKIVGPGESVEVVVGLENPMGIGFDSANALYISEGAPANRISRYVNGEGSRKVIITSDVEPGAILFTPF